MKLQEQPIIPMYHFNKKGFSLVEVLVVISIFAFLGIIVTQMIASSVRSAKKSQNINLVRGSISSAVETINRFIRGAKGITCPLPVPTRINYSDEAGASTYFECTGDNIASGSATIGDVYNLVSDDVKVTLCSFSCVTDSASGVTTVDIVVSGQPKDDIPLSESSNVDITSKIIVRN